MGLADGEHVGVRVGIVVGNLEGPDDGITLGIFDG